MSVKVKKDSMSRSMSASDAKNNFGELLEFARSNPVKINKNGRAVAVVVSVEDFERMEAMEDSWWAKKAEEASKDGFLGQEESEKFLVEMMNAKD